MLDNVSLTVRINTNIPIDETRKIHEASSPLFNDEEIDKCDLNLHTAKKNENTLKADNNPINTQNGQRIDAHDILIKLSIFIPMKRTVINFIKFHSFNN